MKRVLKVIFGWFKRYLSVSFATALIVAFLLWGAVKLGHTYVTDTEFDVVLAEQSANCTAMVEGTGYQILKFQFATRSGVVIERSDVRITYPKADSAIIQRSSLLKTMSSKYNDIKIVSIESIGVLK